jgi:uncharacterized protein
VPTLYDPDAAARQDEAARYRVTFVLKTSKFCNLRCRYCDEFPELGNRHSMGRADLRTMYEHIAGYYSKRATPVEVEFCWHGGEPLLIDPDFYWATFDDQTKVFDPESLKVTNVVQTNLTVLRDSTIRLLKEGFDGVGVSVDLFGGLRVDTAGKDSLKRVLRNMDRIRQAGIDFGCITVLTKQNLPSLSAIFEFFQRACISFRLLPVHRGATDAQNTNVALAQEEVLAAMEQMFDLWLEETSPITVEPLFTYVENFLAARLADQPSWHANANWRKYDKSAWESIYIVNTDGAIYSYADAYKAELSHGNIFQQSLSELVLSPGHRLAITAAESRMAETCTGCRHYGRGCSGYPVAEESPNLIGTAQDGGFSCIKDRGIMDYIEKRLCAIGVVDPISGHVSLPEHYRPQFTRGF